MSTRTHIIRARPYSGCISRFVESYWNSPDGASRVLGVASSTSGLYTLSARKVSDLPIPLPPVAEQRRIVAEVERRLSVIQQAETAVEGSPDAGRPAAPEHPKAGILRPAGGPRTPTTSRPRCCSSESGPSAQRPHQPPSAGRAGAYLLPLPLEVSRRKGESQLPLPLGEGWGEGRTHPMP